MFERLEKCASYSSACICCDGSQGWRVHWLYGYITHNLFVHPKREAQFIGLGQKTSSPHALTFPTIYFLRVLLTAENMLFPPLSTSFYPNDVKLFHAEIGLLIPCRTATKISPCEKQSCLATNYTRWAVNANKELLLNSYKHSVFARDVFVFVAESLLHH